MASSRADADGVEVSDTSAATTKQWERLLWKRQPFPDNYVPPSFLDKLQTNATIVLPSYATLVIWSLPITQQVASILIFVGVFAHLLNEHVSAIELVCGSSLLMLIGWAIIDVCVPEHQSRSRHSGRSAQQEDGPASLSIRARIRSAANAIVSMTLLSLVLLALSPVLRTLTEATTSDSIWALSVCMFALNAALADYSSAGRSVWVTSKKRPSSPSDEVNLTSSSQSKEDDGLTEGIDASGLTSALSLNAAICASVVLGSRLPSDLDVFALMLCAVDIFALLPLASVRLRACELEIIPKSKDCDGLERISSTTHSDIRIGPQARSLAQDSLQPLSRASVPVLRTRHPQLPLQAALTLLLVIGSTTALALLNTSAAFLSVATYLFISAGCPAWMRWAQRWKRELKGPWDPAVPRVWAASQQ
ncbi:hypothetical protein V8E36_000324 [Tilletia maclaganii]